MYYVDNFKDFWSLFLVVVFGFMISILKNFKKTKIGHYTKFLTNLWFWVMHELWKLSMCPQRILQKLNDFFFCTWQKTIWRLFRKKKFELPIYYNSYNFHIRRLEKKIPDSLLFFCLWHYSRQVMTSLLILGLPQSFFFLLLLTRFYECTANRLSM